MREEKGSNCGKFRARIAESRLEYGDVKQLDWLEAPVARGHWRTHDGDEVDLVIEREDGALAAVEVKAASRVTARDLRSLLKLRAKLGAQFLGGVVLHTGARAYTHDGIQVLPISRLW